MGVGYLTRPLWQRELAALANTAEAPYTGNTDTPPLWFEITPDNRIILKSPKVEMGQGTFTGLAQIAADELEVDVEQIEVVHAETASGQIDPFATGGSTSIASLWQPMRELSATLREMLKNEAATLLGGAAGELTVEKGVVTGGGRSLTYGEIATQVNEWSIPATPPLKDPKSYKYVGRAVPRVDLLDKVTGAPIYGIDAELPDMLYGSVVRPTHIDAKFLDADISKAKGMPGVVQIVREPDFVGVVARTRMEAELAKQAIEVTWDIPKRWTTAEIRKMLKVGKGDPSVIQLSGKPRAELKEDPAVVVTEYQSPIGAHAQLEPNGALAHVEKDRATIIMSTQVVKITRDEVADRLDLDVENVNIVPTFLGGGFGRRLHTPNAVQAAVLSRAVGAPVKCYFNRKEEFQQDTFRPPTHHLCRAKLSPEGRIVAFEHNVSSGDVMYGSPLLPAIVGTVLGSDVGAWRGGMVQYRGIPHYRAVSWRVKLPFATSWWRSLGLLANTFAIESFMDELAIRTDQDPVAFRLAHLTDDKVGTRLRKVIESAAERAGYTDAIVDGRAMGFAASTDANTPCAHVAEVSVEEGRIRVHKVTCAMDPGLVVNPDQVRAQCEGSIIMGISAVLYEKMEVEDGQLTPTIYGPYQMALMRDTPREIDVVLLENDDKPGAVGEPPLGPIGAAIANAVFRVTGERLRSFPLVLTNS